MTAALDGVRDVPRLPRGVRMRFDDVAQAHVAAGAGARLRLDETAVDGA